MSEPQTDELIGKKLGNQYEILDEIGRGGMATVYRASQISIKRTVAVKVLPRHFLHDPGFFERFEREVDVIAHLEHPHILPIYDYGKDHNVPYIVMRFLGGGSMAQMIRRGVPKLETLEKPFTQVSQALDHAHRQGVIHRDLKPGNIMLDENGNAYLSDFGIARVLGSNLTGSSQIIGTPAYMSPEQANGFPLDARSDIYSLGIVLFEMITGNEPYQAETPMAMLLKHINEPMPPLTTYRDDIPDAVEQVIRKATAKDPNNRYPSASDMASDFKEAILHTTMSMRSPKKEYEDAATIAPSAASQAKLTPARVATGTKPAPARAGTTDISQPSTEIVKRSLPLPLILGGAAILILGVLAVVLLPSLNSSQEVPVTYIPASPAVPTPFSDSRRIETDEYTVSIPRAWIPPQGFLDHSDETGLINIWQDPNLQVFVALAIPNAANITDQASYEAAVEDYVQQKYETQSTLVQIGEPQTAPDGTLRYSYRLVGNTEPPFPPGQMDAFFINRAPQLAVVEMYSSDGSGNQYVPTFQSILDSVQLKTTT